MTGPSLPTPAGKATVSSPARHGGTVWSPAPPGEGRPPGTPLSVLTGQRVPLPRCVATRTECPWECRTDGGERGKGPEGQTQIPSGCGICPPSHPHSHREGTDKGQRLRFQCGREVRGHWEPVERATEAGGLPSAGHWAVLQDVPKEGTIKLNPEPSGRQTDRQTEEDRNSREASRNCPVAGMRETFMSLCGARTGWGPG